MFDIIKKYSKGFRVLEYIFLLVTIFAFKMVSAGTIEFYVAVSGNDHNSGKSDAPFATIQRAQEAVRQRPQGEGAIVWIREGVYHLKQALQFTADDSGTPDAPVIFTAVEGERVEISGSQLLRLDWVREKNGRWKAKVPGRMDFDQLFADGAKMIRARYPNYDPGDGFFGGLSRDATDSTRLRRYADPEGMYVHGYHGLGWGSLHFRILQKSPDGKYIFEAGKDPRVAGGWQNKGRAETAEAPFSPDQRFVENVIEELDASKEWYFDHKSSTLYFIPPAKADPRHMAIEAVTLKRLITISGSQKAPVRNLSFRGLQFRKAGYTFMETTDVPSGGDWRIYRGGAIVFESTEDCSVRNCVFDGIGGNGIFVKDYNRRLEITASEFSHIGASAILFDGDKAAMRSRWAHSWGWPESEMGPRPAVNSNKAGGHLFLSKLPASTFNSLTGDSLIDLKPGPRGENYPSGCMVQDCLISDIGTVEKQVSGVFISKCRNIVVSHVVIHDIPRAAININDGMWGGHIIEWCDIFNTCLESREHGAINTWGRDRFWVRMQTKATPDEFDRMQSLSRIDAVDVITIRYNRIQCASGYDIDLDDGSTHYNIYSNLCLQGGIKLREGFFRTVSNNITPLISTHVWYPNSHDVISQNILIGEDAYSPRGMTFDGKVVWVDFNLFAIYKIPGSLLKIGVDVHSLTADPQFIHPGTGDYGVRPGSPAEKIGFVNFPMDHFGVISPLLKSHTKEWSGLKDRAKALVGEAGDSSLYQWAGATLRNLFNYGRESAIVGGVELSDNRGVLIKSVAAGSIAAHAQLPGDAVIVAANKRPVASIAALRSILNASGSGPVLLKILTEHGFLEITLERGNELPDQINKKQKNADKL